MPTGQKTILVIEDSSRVRALIVEMLLSAGYRVLEADGPAGVDQYFNDSVCPVDLLLTDLMLPGISGIAVAGRLKELCPTMKALYMSGYDLQPQPDMEFIEKPFRSEQLLEIVSRMLAAGNG